MELVHGEEFATDADGDVQAGVLEVAPVFAGIRWSGRAACTTAQSKDR